MGMDRYSLPTFWIWRMLSGCLITWLGPKEHSPRGPTHRRLAMASIIFSLSGTPPAESSPCTMQVPTSYPMAWASSTSSSGANFLKSAMKSWFSLWVSQCE